MKKTLLFILGTICCLTSFAQTNEITNRDAKGNVIRGPYLTNRFWDNWFLELGGGQGQYLGWQNENSSERMNTVLDLSFGKWFTPTVGIRISCNYNDVSKQYIDEQQYRFNFWNVHADFMWNMINAFGGYKEKRVYQLIPYFGAGYGQSFGANYYDGTKGSFILNLGLINKFRVSNRIDLNLELRGSACSSEFDNMNLGNNSFDIPIAATAGITFKFGKTNFQRLDPNANAEQLAIAVEQVLKEKNEDILAVVGENQKLVYEIDSLKTHKPKVVVTQTKSSFGDIPKEGIIFFDYGKSELNQKEKVHLETFAYYVKQIVASGKKITLVGSASQEASSADLKMKLSKDRANTIKNILVKKYGISSDKLDVKAEGDTNNIFGDNELDRCVYVRF